MSANNLRELTPLQLEALCEQRGAELLATAAELADVRRKSDAVVAELRATNETLSTDVALLVKWCSDKRNFLVHSKEAELDRVLDLIASRSPAVPR